MIYFATSVCCLSTSIANEVTFDFSFFFLLFFVSL